MMKFLKQVVFAALFCTFLSTSAQNNVEWATKLLLKTDKYSSPTNYPELILGPPSIYPDYDYDRPMMDPYADGYVLNQLPAKEDIVLGFKKPLPSNQMIIGGIFNDGVIRKIYLIDKENKEIQVYSHSSQRFTNKTNSMNIFYKLFTVYGVKLQLDHSKVNQWNIIKGIGIIKSEDTINIQPFIYEQARFPSPKDTIGHNINTPECYEFNPRLSSDATKLFFVKECPGQNDQDIWVSELDEKTNNWLPAHNMGKPLNNGSYNFVASVGLDGNSLLIGNTYKEDGSEGGPGVSISKRQSNGSWSLPQKVEIPKLDNINENANYFESLDGQVMIIAVEDEKSIGDLDLYVSTYNKHKKAWDEPFNLGSAINTAFAEDYPYLAPDGVTLYFSSKGYLGYGGHDIYVTKRLDNTWKKWSIPHNLGSVINSKADDKGFMISNSGDIAYFNTVAYDSSHTMDIFRIRMPKELQQIPQVLIKGRIFNKKTGKAIKTVLKFKDSENKRNEYMTVTNDDEGYFSFTLPFGKSYDVSIDIPNYFRMTDKIVLNDTNNKSKLLKEYAIEQYLDSGEVTVMRNILFEFGTAKLKDSVVAELDNMVAKLRQQNKSVIEIGGHTDDVGTDEFNLKLSEERAKTVMEYLISKGIRDWRLRVKGYGEIAPIADNETNEGRRLNRRVEVKILEDDFTKKFKKSVAKQPIDKDKTTAQSGNSDKIAEKSASNP